MASNTDPTLTRFWSSAPTSSWSPPPPKHLYLPTLFRHPGWPYCLFKIPLITLIPAHYCRQLPLNYAAIVRQLSAFWLQHHYSLWDRLSHLIWPCWYSCLLHTLFHCRLWIRVRKVEAWVRATSKLTCKKLMFSTSLTLVNKLGLISQ